MAVAIPSLWWPLKKASNIVCWLHVWATVHSQHISVWSRSSFDENMYMFNHSNNILYWLMYNLGKNVHIMTAVKFMT
jgi:hypothetical protein